MKKVYTASNKIEADLIVSQLDQIGIKGIIDGEHLQGLEMLQSSGFVHVCVSDYDYEEAKSVINDIENSKIEEQKETQSHSTRSNIFFLLLGQYLVH